ncbi:MAG: hypothetical protein AAF081_02480 [Actinomycetota bacterium]
MAIDPIVQDRLTELVSALSGTPDAVARLALDRADGDETLDDPLAAVAGALVAIRRNDLPVLAGAST